MLGRFRTVSNELWPLVFAISAGCAEAAIDDDASFDDSDSAIVVADGSSAGGDAAVDTLDATFDWPDTGTLYDSSVSYDGSTPIDASVIDAGKADAGSQDAGSPKDAGVDASAQDAGPRDAGSDASAPDAGKADASTPDAGSNMCKQEDCKNSCSIASPFRCCQSDGQCGCSWVSGIYCN